MLAKNHERATTATKAIRANPRKKAAPAASKATQPTPAASRAAGGKWVKFQNINHPQRRRRRRKNLPKRKRPRMRGSSLLPPHPRRSCGPKSPKRRSSRATTESTGPRPMETPLASLPATAATRPYPSRILRRITRLARSPRLLEALHYAGRAAPSSSHCSSGRTRNSSTRRRTRKGCWGRQWGTCLLWLVCKRRSSPRIRRSRRGRSPRKRRIDEIQTMKMMARGGLGYRSTTAPSERNTESIMGSLGPCGARHSSPRLMSR
mmetsp:Transcript_32212/g.68593  ORF Transcript_32212/g.68593 Transcript_32212/m.68593 type:complete len:263 (-) Transcript_32212:674-1462(-)